jgi:hypothetical protein
MNRVESDFIPEEHVKIILAILLPALCASTAGAQVEGGSVLIATYSPNEIVMAADSRLVNEQTGQFQDNYCKVAVPGGKILFGGTGIVGSIGGFDALRLARQIVESEGANPAGGLVLDTATRWADAMDENFAKMPPDIVRQVISQDAGNRALDCTLFAGSDSSGELSLVRARLFYGGASSGGLGAVRYRIEIIPVTSSNPNELNIAGCGHVDILEELTPPKSDWAKEEVRQWMSLQGDVQAQVAVRLVQLTVEREKAAQFGPRNVVPVGGPVDAVELKRAGGINWIQRKPACAAN